jgi:hypothetical protein
VYNYIVLFYNQTGAVKFFRSIRAKGLDGRLQAVPRKLSSSCGTAVRLFSDESLEVIIPDIPDEVESVFMIDDDEYKLVYRNVKS